jgi:hypothetical protein
VQAGGADVRWEQQQVQAGSRRAMCAGMQGIKEGFECDMRLLHGVWGRLTELRAQSHTAGETQMRSISVNHFASVHVWCWAIRFG